MAKVTGKAPPALANKPSPDTGLHSYLQAFKRLSGSRAMNGSAAGQIPFSEMVAYMAAYSISRPSHKAMFIGLVRVCDDEWMTLYNARVESETKRRQPGARGRRHTRR